MNTATRRALLGALAVAPAATAPACAIGAALVVPARSPMMAKLERQNQIIAWVNGFPDVPEAAIDHQMAVANVLEDEIIDSQASTHDATLAKVALLVHAHDIEDALVDTDQAMKALRGVLAYLRTI